MEFEKPDLKKQKVGSEDKRRTRLDRRNERARQRRKNETEEEKAARLSKRNAKDRARRRAEHSTETEKRLQKRKQYIANEVAEKKAARLEHMSVLQQVRLVNETPEKRAARLEHLSALQEARLANETPEKRAARLEHLSALQEARLANETAEKRAARLEHVNALVQEHLANETSDIKAARLDRMRSFRKERLAKYSNESHLPQFEDKLVKEKMDKFHHELSVIQSPVCSICSERFPGTNMASLSTECQRCFRDKENPKLYSSRNNMDPGMVPPQLQGLSQAEEMLISAVMPLMSICRLPHGQYGYKGHVVNLPQDISSFASSLPRCPKDLDVLIVKKDCSENTHRDFRVRLSVMLHALQWLKQHNKYYRDVQIDFKELSQLPDDGNLTGLTVVQDPAKLHEDDQHNEQTDEDFSQDQGSFVPINIEKNTEKEAIRKSVTERQKSVPEQAVSWPSRGDNPINEFVTEGYISCAFPTLLPTGDADFLAPRERGITVGNYFKHLMRYKDGRFAKHPRFRYFALNTEMRWRALQTGRIYIKHHPNDARLSLDELREMVNSGGEQFSKRVVHFANTLRGTRQFWFKQRSRLISMIDTLGMPTVFFTHSAADNQWPELARLIAEDPDSSSSRCCAVNANPAIADWFFY